MVGRTPEYLGKKIEAYDVKVSVLAVLVLCFSILGFAAWAAVSAWGMAGLNNTGPHGLSEILYAYSSAVGQQRQRLCGIERQHPLAEYDPGDGHALRPFLLDHPGSGPGGKPGGKEAGAGNAGSFPVSGLTFLVLLVGTVLIVGALTFLPGPGPGADRGAFYYDAVPGEIILNRGYQFMAAKQLSLFESEISSPEAFWALHFEKLDPLTMMKNPVMFVTEVGALITTVGLFFRPAGESLGFGLQVAIWLWFTVLFANFAEAMAEGRGKAQADAFRKTRTQTIANRILASGATEQVPAETLRKGDVVIVSAGEMIPADGEIIEGVATVDESAITGESAPGHPRGRRRPERRHRRHPGVLRPDQGRGDGQSRGKLSWTG